MIGIILVIAITVVAAIVTWRGIFLDRYSDRNLTEGLVATLMAVVAAICGGAVAFAVFIGLPQLASGTCQVRTTPMVALQDGTGTAGSGGLFYVGFGPTGTYNFYLGDPNGMKKNYVINSAGVEVYDNADKPYASWLDDCQLDNWNWLAPYLGSGNGKITELHVPAGTIKTDMILDAK